MKLFITFFVLVVFVAVVTEFASAQFSESARRYFKNSFKNRMPRRNSFDPRYNDRRGGFGAGTLAGVGVGAGFGGYQLGRNRENSPKPGSKKEPCVTVNCQVSVNWGNLWRGR